ncbi:maleylpyruvate isomerase N-terminal domain-containing protein [Planosporangium mesophilum]|uniref:Mycothiol-dependent maleylpyruvate isomerase metal-binding domain-containing protein n=1 Tax=Planosporangium mesophilum TaxID=689768 RepID=A0A8J3THL2_9ACTN|nr:maleylpyruvate isomerase N-terminal domain-containing protein [Planosporangium mesophilum]NJC85934.1 maleylpyruvate isomerase family mycothiol-dependent enzyme [Planosporangium mesophilum]GII25646.1 hypothetical protein Pme01_52430 [Planosporangium mesophilum]
MPTREVYAATRSRLLDLAGRLDDDAAARSVPACPGWSIKDTYAHLAGVCADVLDDRRAAHPGWGERTVAERRDQSLTDVVAEWTARGSTLDERLHGDEVFHLGVDAWSHEHDIRGALGLPADTPAETAWVRDRLVSGFQARWAKSTLPPIRFAVDGAEHLLGTGEPIATLHCDAFTLGRVLMGRRSRRQVAALDWSGNPEPILDRLFAFGPADDDVHY